MRLGSRRVVNAVCVCRAPAVSETYTAFRGIEWYETPYYTGRALGIRAGGGDGSGQGQEGRYGMNAVALGTARFPFLFELACSMRSLPIA